MSYRILKTISIASVAAERPCEEQFRKFVELVDFDCAFSHKPGCKLPPYLAEWCKKDSTRLDWLVRKGFIEDSRHPIRGGSLLMRRETLTGVSDVVAVFADMGFFRLVPKTGRYKNMVVCTTKSDTVEALNKELRDGGADVVYEPCEGSFSITVERGRE